MAKAIPIMATVVGADPRNDIAFLQVDAPAELLVPVELGTSDNLLVGQRAIAIGNPFGQFGRTLTTGVISALGRTLEGDDGRPFRVSSRPMPPSIVAIRAGRF